MPGAVRVAPRPAPAPRGQDASTLPRSTRTIRGFARLLDDAGDQVALAPGELAEGDVVLGLAQPLRASTCSRGGRGDPAEALGGVVELAQR